MVGDDGDALLGIAAVVDEDAGENSARLPFPSIVAASRNDALGDYDRVNDLAAAWGSRVVDLGEVGHLNPATGFGDWSWAAAPLEELGYDLAAIRLAQVHAGAAREAS